ncbi:MAG: hypothetical protein HQL72_05555 [Magnetococcales bacterium]|nr:hypothetical protein [Magnetococcales bacterium]
MAGTFSESWYRVASIRTALRPTVQVRKQRFRGQWWYLLHDVFNNAFFRLSPGAYAFLSRLSLSRTVDEVWQECLDANPDTAPGQVAVLQLLTQFNNDNLLYFDTPTDSAKLLAKQVKSKKRQQRSKLFSFLSLRINLLDPNPWLDRVYPFFRPLFSRGGLLIWLATILVAGALLLPRLEALSYEASSVLAPDNLILLYVGMVLTKWIHEFGHAASCKHFGGEVHTAGVLFILFTPMPFVDATASWSFRSRWQRILVGSAGMMFELFIAALCAFAWVYSAPGILHTIAYNMMFTASVSTLVFNANPLMKFDGYFILSDWLDIPNLQSRAQAQLNYLAERFLFGVQGGRPAGYSRQEGSWLVAYGIGSAIYKVFLTTFIILFVSEHYLFVGGLMALMMLVMWFVVPPFKLLRYLAFSSRLSATRGRAVTVTALLLLLILAGGSLIALPNTFRAPGVTESTAYYQVLTAASGEVVERVAKPGDHVQEGEVLVRLENRELALDILDARAQWEQVLIQEQMANSRGGLQMDSILKRKESIAKLLKQLQQQEAALRVRARQAGLWVAPEMVESLGRWVAKGSQMGMVLDQGHTQFIAVVSQEEAASLFAEQEHARLEVRLNGRAVDTIPVADYQVIPFQREQLPSSALGWLGGGEIAVSGSDKQGRQSLEPFFLVRAHLENRQGLSLLHGHAGKLRVTLPAQPLWRQLEIKLRQFLQQRYLT